MSITPLIQTPLPERCYLIEALMWGALLIFPLSSRCAVAWTDDRERPDNIQGILPFLPHHHVPTDEQCSLAGLPPCPAYEEIKNERSYDSPESLQRWMADPTITAEFREGVAQLLPKAVDFAARQKAWEDRFGSEVKVHRDRLIAAFLDGHLRAVGVSLQPELLDDTTDLESLPRPTRPVPAGVEELLRENAGLREAWNAPVWEPIAPQFWSAAEVRWEGCWAKSESAAFCLIMIETDGLFTVFPPPAARPISGVGTIGGAIVLGEESNPPDSSRRRGRPSYDWPSLHNKILEWKESGQLQGKQDAAVSQAAEWCFTNWGKTPGRSTLAQQLSRYFQQKQKSRNSN